MKGDVHAVEYYPEADDAWLALATQDLPSTVHEIYAVRRIQMDLDEEDMWQVYTRANGTKQRYFLRQWHAPDGDDTWVMILDDGTRGYLYTTAEAAMEWMESLVD
jgi:hypothetical protein